MEIDRQGNNVPGDIGRKLAEHVSDRLKLLPMRICLYSLTCIMAVSTLGFWPSAAAGALLICGDVIDTYGGKILVRRLLAEGFLERAERLAIVMGLGQCLMFTAAVAIYFFRAGEQANFLFVCGALGLAATNAAIGLPRFPKLGVIRLGIYFLSPLLMLSAQAVRSMSLDVFRATDTAGFMVLFCLLYIFVMFTQSGFKNYRITEALEVKEAELQKANQNMVAQQKELRRLSLVARKANDSIVLSDPERRIIWINEAFTDVTGFTAEDAIGVKLPVLLSGQSEELLETHPIDEAVAQGKSFHSIVPNVTKDGRDIWVDVNLFPVHDEQGQIEFYVSIERDVTETREQAIEMAKAREEAEQGARAKAEFLANMSHEIRTPLAGIVGMADLLSESPLNDEQMKFVRSIVGSSQSLMGVINDVLDLSLLESGRIKLSPTTFDLQAMFSDTIELLGTSAKNADVTISLDYCPEAPQIVYADEGRLRQVIVNLLGNALKFTASGRVDVLVKCMGQGPEQYLEFDVKDTGIGIPEDKLAQVFERFTQAEADTTRRFGGTGLGLTICKHIVDVAGGDISVSSVVGKGTTFSVRVPIEVVDELGQSGLSAAHQVDIDFDGLPTLDILVAEDNKTNRLLISKYLDGLPFNLTFAENGLQAVEIAQHITPDLVFMDVSMPFMGGLEATREIRKLDIAQPTIVALTAHAFESEMQACLSAGMDHFLTKPIRKKDLLAWLHTYSTTGRSGTGTQEFVA